MENVIVFKELSNNWYEGKLIIGDQLTTISGCCEKDPMLHLQSAYRFFVQGGIRAQCVFNLSSTCHLIVLRRQDDMVKVEVVTLDKRFENNAKLKSHQYLDANIVFSASTSLGNFAHALFTNENGAHVLH